VTKARRGVAAGIHTAQARAVPADPKQAFVEGYKAYSARDYVFAARCFEFAADRYPELADHSLYFLSESDSKFGARAEAETALERLIARYPQSVFAERAELAIAEMELEERRARDAETRALRLLRRTRDSEIEQNCRLVLARTRSALSDPRGAYEQLQEIRNRYPRGNVDPQARVLERSLLEAHPEVVEVGTVAYHRREAELLLREGLASDAAAQARAGLALAPARAVRAELLWLEARASRASNPERAVRAINQYLATAPRGVAAPAALDMLGHIYWNRNETTRARATFAWLVRRFPSSRFAPDAMFAIARTFEEQEEPGNARAVYRRLSARYRSSEFAAEARFRWGFIPYMETRYESAARAFAVMTKRARDGSEHDRFAYWEARAIEKTGEPERAHRIYQSLALSTASNYYPALAAARIGADAPPSLAAAFVPDRVSPPNLEGDAAFHLERVLALRAIGLSELAPAELGELEKYSRRVPKLRGFVLTGYEQAGAWSDAIKAATRMGARGEISPELAERIRYPRGYWNLVNQVARQNGLDPYLVLALMRQESLFDPEARSVSDARGLMQLLPATAARMAGPRQIDASNLYDPALNVRLGAAYLRQLFQMFHGNVFRAVAAYNGGEHAVERWAAKFPGDDDQWVENIGYRETREYVKKVIGGLREYRMLYPSGRDGSLLPRASLSSGSMSARTSSISRF
jgi:peptidoglycan lytic transglycosylase